MLKMSDDSKISLINDNAIDKIKFDALDFDVYSQVLAESILETPSPFSIGIYGESGKGKTSLLNFLINDISNKKTKTNILTAFYDAWKFESDENPVVDLLTIIEKSIQEQKINLSEDIVITLFDYLKYIKLAIFNITNKKDANLVKNEFDVENHLLEIYDLLKKFENILIEENFSIIIYIDNLDRCSAKNIVKILESINLIFNLKGFSFVIAADKKVLEEQLETNIKDSKDYIDKTIKVPFYLPSFNGKLSELLENIHLKTVSGNSLEEGIKNVIYSISSLSKLTPRFVIKLINRIKISTKIYTKLNPNSHLSKENILSLFSISCVLEELFNELHTILIKNDAITKQIIDFMQSEIFYKDELLSNINILPKEKEILVLVLENNFKILKNIFSTEQGKYWLENKIYRISTHEFLKSNNKITENIQIDSSPTYKTDFSDNIISINNSIKNPKEFISIPNQDYEFSKYVITNKWFEEFILAKGYENPKYWNNLASKVWLINNKIYSIDEKYDYMVKKESIYFKKKFKKELIKEDFNSALQPVVYVTYYEALAFCRYLSDIDSEYEYFIPTKEQWEHVASAGDKNRDYPWGNIWNKDYCNNGTNQLNKTTEIGLFPQGDSKFGVSDMVGNVWVWTSSLDNNDYNYLKGGSWNFNDPSYFKILDTQMTFYTNPSYQHYDIGFLCIRKKK